MPHSFPKWGVVDSNPPLGRSFIGAPSQTLAPPNHDEHLVASAEEVKGGLA